MTWSKKSHDNKPEIIVEIVIVILLTLIELTIIMQIHIVHTDDTSSV